MNTIHNRWATISLIVFLLAASGYHCSSSRKSAEQEAVKVINTNIDGNGVKMSLALTKGEAHNHPLMAVWLEDTLGNYIETLFIAKSIGKGIFEHGDKSKGTWEAGPIRRPAALPYWSHKRGVRAPDGLYLPTPEEPMPDAVTGPTPKGNFMLNTNSTEKRSSAFVILMEINQSWDWNEYWTNNMYTDDEQYRTSSQPSLVYAVEIDPNAEQEQFIMKPIGHGHYAGKDGSLTEDLSTLTTALDIVKSATVTVWQNK
jgi:hypothetical protein